MKHLILSSALLIAFGASASAQEEGPKPKPKQERGIPERLKQFDKDKDGKLDKAEREAAKKWLSEQNEGAGSGDEGRRRRPGAGDGEGRRRPGAGDGEGRRRPGAGDGEGRRRPGAGDGEGRRRPGAGDGEGRRRPGAGDGEGRRRMTPEERKALLKKFDKDGDGKLNEKERRAMREHIRAQRGNGDKPGAKPGDKPGAKPGAKPGNKPPVRGEGGRRRPGADKKNPGDRKDGKGQIGSDNV